MGLYISNRRLKKRDRGINYGIIGSRYMLKSSISSISIIIQTHYFGQFQTLFIDVHYRKYVINTKHLHMWGSSKSSAQWWNVNYSSNVFKYKFEVLSHYLSVKMICYILLPLHYIFSGNILAFYFTSFIWQLQ